MPILLLPRSASAQNVSVLQASETDASQTFTRRKSKALSGATTPAGVLFNIDYEAGVNGNAVGAESTWDTISGTAVYQNTVVANGALGIKATGQSILRKNITARNIARGRWFFRVPVISTGGTSGLMAMARSGTTSTASIRYETAGTLRLLNVATATGSSSSSLTANELVRCEWQINGNTATQTLELYRGANVNGTTPDETLSGTYTNATFDNLGVAWYSIIAGFDIYYDEVVFTDAPTVQIGGFAASGPTETDAAQVITRRHSRTLGQSAETDTVTAVARSKARTVGQVAEVDAAQPIGRRKARAVGQATATNTAQALARTHSRTLGQPAETDTANAAGRVSSTAVGQPTETDAAQALSRRKSRVLGQAAETDAPLAITRQGTFGQPLETDVALPIGRRKLRTVGQSAETDAPQALTRSKRRTTGQPSETDAATVTARRKARTAAQAVETDLANPVTPPGKVRQAVETDLAQPITRIKRHAVAQAVETEAGQAFTRRHARTIGQPSEVDACQLLARRRLRTVGQATETDAPLAITVPVVFMAGSVGSTTLTAPAPTVGAGIGVRAPTVGPNPPVGVPSVKGQ